MLSGSLPKDLRHPLSQTSPNNLSPEYPVDFTTLRTEVEKSNIAAFKPEVPISKLVDKVGTKVQLLYVFEVQLPNRTNGSVLRPYTRNCNSKMASSKPEILLSQLEEKVGT